MPRDEVWIHANANSSPLTNYRFYLTPRETLRLKVVGFMDGHRLQFKASKGGMYIHISQSGQASWRENTLTISAHHPGVEFITASVPTAHLTHCLSPTGRYHDCFPHLRIEVLESLRMPADLSEEQRALLHVLLAEVHKPSTKETASTGKYEESSAIQSMRFMRQALLNRLSFSHPHYVGVPKNNTTLIGVIRAPDQISGFNSWPALATRVQENIDALLKQANTGQHPNFMASRRLVASAIGIARGEMPAPSTLEPVYAWRTAGSSSPGGNYKKLFTLAGQDFYGLRQEYIDSLGKAQ